MAAALNWHEQAKALDFRSQAFIGGKYVPAASGETFENISPIDGKLLARVAACDKEDVDRAVKAGKVRAIGCSEWTAEQIEAAASIAAAEGLTAFSSNQPQYSLIERDVEREVPAPMACVNAQHEPASPRPRAT